jgi:drug/metabolite transporter (DMT)-like permease
MSQEYAKKRRLALFELHAAIFLVGMTGLFGKFLDIAPVLIVFGRALFASAVLGIVLLMMHRKKRVDISADGKRHWGWMAVSGALLAMHWVAFFQSIRLSTVAVGLLTFSSFPIFVTLLEPWFFRERRRLLDLITAVLVLGGISLIVPNFDLNDNITQGAVWGILSGFVYALLCILNRRLVASFSPLALTAGQNFFAGLILLPAVVWIGIIPSPREIMLLALLGVIFTALAHYLFIAGLSQVRAQLASVVTGLESVYGILFALLFLGEVPGVRTLLGGAVVLGAVVLATLARPDIGEINRSIE